MASNKSNPYNYKSSPGGSRCTERSRSTSLGAGGQGAREQEGREQEGREQGSNLAEEDSCPGPREARGPGASRGLF